MNEAVDILLAIVNRIKSAECGEDTTVARLETEAFQGTLNIYMQRGRITQAEYSIFHDYLAEFAAKFYAYGVL